MDDVRRVTGQELKIDESKPGKVSARYAIIAGTIGKSGWIDVLASRNKIDTAAIAGSWERYMIEVVNNPVPGIKKAIVVAGSDRRGTAYGLLSISKAIGVSPWYWWADAPIKQQKQVSVKVDKFISKTPSVKFRGVFINDEDWGLYRWSKRNFEKNVETSDRERMQKCVNCCCVFRLIIFVRLCTMHLWHSTVFLKIAW